MKPEHLMWSIAAVFVAACGRFDFGALGDARGDGEPDPDAAPVVHSTRSTLTLAQDPGELLTDFPLFVSLDDTRADRAIMRPDASDLRFYDAGGNVLAHEIEQLGAPGGAPLIVWLRVPQIVGAATTIDVDYGDTPAATSTMSVWSPSYIAVYHMADASDATTNHHDGSIFGPVVTGAGLTGPALQFAGNGAIVIPDSPDFGFTGLVIISTWIDATMFSSASHYNAVVSRESTAASHDLWLGVNDMPIGVEAQVTTTVGPYGAIGNPPTTDAWHSLGFAYDGTAGQSGLEVTLDLNGAGAAGLMGTATHNPHSIVIGADCTGNNETPNNDFYTGAIDEVRIESSTHPGAWSSYEILGAHDMLITYGPVM